MSSKYTSGYGVVRPYDVQFHVQTEERQLRDLSHDGVTARRIT